MFVSRIVEIFKIVDLKRPYKISLNSTVDIEPSLNSICKIANSPITVIGVTNIIILEIRI